MKLAVGGKGGSGKTTISGTMARLAARRGVEVLAVAADINPNLAITLGVEPERGNAITPLPHGLLEHVRVDGETVLRLSRPVEELTAEYAVECPDQVRLVLMGRPVRAGTG